MVDLYFSTLVMKGTLSGFAIIRYVQICEALGSISFLL